MNKLRKTGVAICVAAALMTAATGCGSNTNKDTKPKSESVIDSGAKKSGDQKETRKQTDTTEKTEENKIDKTNQSTTDKAVSDKPVQKKQNKKEKKAPPKDEKNRTKKKMQIQIQK